jgi:hypothetical protein
VGPVSLSSPEAGRRTHRAVDRVFIGLLHKGKRLSRNGTVTSHNVKCGDRALLACAARAWADTGGHFIWRLASIPASLDDFV